MPVSRAGRVVNDFLLGSPARPAKELLFQVFVVAMRRFLAREPDPDAAANHVMGAFVRLGIEPDERTVQKGIGLVAAALGSTEVKDRDAYLVGTLLIDLVRTQGMPEPAIAMLVAAGERRFKRWWRKPPSVPPSTGVKTPRTIAGHRLKALALQDMRAARAFTEDPSPDCAQAVIDNAFFIAVRERFGEKPEPEHITLLAQSIAAADVKSLVLAEYDDSDLTETETTAATEVKAAVFARIVDDLGLYDHEIDDLIVMAESIAAEDGCELSLWEAEDGHR